MKKTCLYESAKEVTGKAEGVFSFSVMLCMRLFDAVYSVAELVVRYVLPFLTCIFIWQTHLLSI